MLMHEHGHGLGYSHVDPTVGVKLMEPFLNTGFDGPQQDDIRGFQLQYGDNYESNNTPGAATAIGPMSPTGTVAASCRSRRTEAALETGTSVDYYSFEVLDPNDSIRLKARARRHRLHSGPTGWSATASRSTPRPSSISTSN
jgi:hypothetical protein